MARTIGFLWLALACLALSRASASEGGAAAAAGAGADDLAELPEGVDPASGVPAKQVWEQEIFNLVSQPHAKQPERGPRQPNRGSLDLASLREILADAAIHPDGYADASGKTALMMAAAAGQFDAVKMLVGNGADPSKTTKNGATALLAACGVRLGKDEREGMSAAAVSAFQEGIRAVVKHLLKIGTQAAGAGYVNMATKSGRTALVQAITGGDVVVARMLIEAGAKTDGVSPHGDTMAMGACFQNNPALLDTVLEFRAANPTFDLAATNILGKTALHYAAEFNCLACVRTLLKEAGAAALLKRKSHAWNHPNGAQTPRQYAESAAIYYRNAEVVKALREAEAAAGGEEQDL